jgi:hypothetical protein
MRTEYRVIVKHNTHELAVDIAHFLKEGWECLGGVSIAYDNGPIIYAQAIIKKYEK